MSDSKCCQSIDAQRDLLGKGLQRVPLASDQLLSNHTRQAVSGIQGLELSCIQLIEQCGNYSVCVTAHCSMARAPHFVSRDASAPCNLYDYMHHFAMHWVFRTTDITLMKSEDVCAGMPVRCDGAL